MTVRESDMGIIGDSAKTEIDRRAALAGIPVLMPGVELETGDDGRLTAVVHLKRPEGFLARFMHPVSSRRIRLDEIGSFVLSQIDGRRSVMEIIGCFIGKYRINKREAELSIAEFLGSLVKRNVIAIGIRK